MIDSMGNTISADVREKLAELLGEFEHKYGFLLEGRLTVGTTVIWFQRAPSNEPMEYVKAPEPAVYNLYNEVSMFSPAQKQEIAEMIQQAFNRAMVK